MNWQALQEEYDVISQRLVEESLDRRERSDLQRKASQYGDLLAKHQEELELEKSLAETQQLATEDSDLAELYEEEIASLQENLVSVRQELEELLYPADEHDSRSVFLEIRAGAGGQEAALFAADLFKMYSAFAASHGWKVSVVNMSENDIGGIREIVAHVKGKNGYRHFKFESGVHRVQRVPETESQGRVHTSTVTVAVLPEAEDVDVTIDQNDLRIDVFRSSGPGGQSVNTTDSAVRITHIPTGIVVSCQDERSQIKNKAKAMKVLQSRLLSAEKERRDAEMSATRKAQVGGGSRAEKIRTYNFPQNRVTDHRVGLTLKKLDLVMAGDLNDLILPLLAWDLEQRKTHGELFSK